MEGDEWAKHRGFLRVVSLFLIQHWHTLFSKFTECPTPRVDLDENQRLDGKDNPVQWHQHTDYTYWERGYLELPTLSIQFCGESNFSRNYLVNQEKKISSDLSYKAMYQTTSGQAKSWPPETARCMTPLTWNIQHIQNCRDRT